MQQNLLRNLIGLHYFSEAEDTHLEMYLDVGHIKHQLLQV